MVINNDSTFGRHATKQVICDSFNNEIEVWVMNVPSVGMYILKLVGARVSAKRTSNCS
ncbi:MAG: hypothetical protein IPG89_08055 [Bacteroidetes bacterium]|nr:hypothetical protein [Bacteroidota bacterium]